MEDCIFCKIVNGKIESEKIYENDNFLSILDINQDISGHSLIISKKHFKTILDLPSTLGLELLDCVKKTSLKILEKEKVGGFNVLGNNFEVAGQEVKHFHMHIFPRKKDDGVKLVS